MVAGADSIDDVTVLRHGGTGRILHQAYAPSALGSFLQAFTFGHVRQFDTIASRFPPRLASRALLIVPADGQMVMVDDAIIDVHGHTKQGSGYGYSDVRGLNALLATVSAAQSAPVDVSRRRHDVAGLAAAGRLVTLTGRVHALGAQPLPAPREAVAVGSTPTSSVSYPLSRDILPPRPACARWCMPAGAR